MKINDVEGKEGDRRRSRYDCDMKIAGVSVQVVRNRISTSRRCRW